MNPLEGRVVCVLAWLAFAMTWLLVTRPFLLSEGPLAFVALVGDLIVALVLFTFASEVVIENKAR